MSAALPSALVRRKLAALRWRAALARWLNQLTLLAALLAALQLSYFALALGPGLHVLGMRIALAVFVAVAVGVPVAMLLRSRRRVNDRALAALFEQRYPQLSEMLLTTVAIGNAASASSFLTQLRDATDRQIAPLEPRDVLSLQRPVRRAAATIAVILMLIALFGISPRYARFCSRFFGAWSDAAAGYRVAVVPGDAWAARGRTATVEVRLVHDDPDVALPTECFVVFHAADGAPERVRMDASADRFLYSWPRLDADVTYGVEAGDASAGPFQLTAVDPVELAGPPEIQLRPPPYVNVEHLPARTLSHGGSFTALQFSTVRLALRFTAEPVRVTLAVHESSRDAAIREQAVPCDGKAATVLLPVDRCGTFAGSLHIEGEHGITTKHPLAGWRVVADTPPRFVEPLHVRGVRDPALYDKEHRIAPDDPLRVQAVVEDAEGLGAIALEYRVNDGATIALPWADGAGRLRVAVDRRISLPQRLNAGNRVRFRLCAADNRALSRAALSPTIPSEALTPQVTYSPGSDHWVELTVGKSGDSLLRQEIVDQHGELDRRLEQVRQKLEKEHDLLGQVRLATHQRSAVSPAQTQQLAEAGRLNEAAAKALDELAAKLADVPELAALADHLRAIAESELAQAAQAMSRFQRPERTADERAKDAQASETAVLGAMKKLNGLASFAERLAQGRLDRVEMERLALQEQDLAQRVEAMLAEGEVRDAELAKLRTEQERVAARLQELGQKSAMLRDALAQTEAKQLAEHAAAAAKQLMKDGAHGAGAGAEKKMLDAMKQLAEQTLRLAQQAGTDEAKKMAEASAQAADSARQAMAKSMSTKAQAKPGEAKAMLAEAVQKLELMQKQLQGGGDAKMKTAAALAESQKLVQAARMNLQARPVQAPRAMRQAAGALDRAAQQMSQQLAQSLPKRAGRPASGAAGMSKTGRFRLPAALAKKLEPFQGKSWGELPGELKTQLLQDARARFGEDYAPIIQHYFEQIAGPDLPRGAPSSKRP